MICLFLAALETAAELHVFMFLRCYMLEDSQADLAHKPEIPIGSKTQQNFVAYFANYLPHFFYQRVVNTLIMKLQSPPVYLCGCEHK